MTKPEIILRVREKLAKLHVYNNEAHKLFGAEAARDMYQKDLDFYASLLVLIGKVED